MLKELQKSCMAAVCLFLIGLSLSISETDAAEPHVARGQHSMVASVSPLATEVGAKVLAEGGNAVDAAIAIAFTQQVTWPEAGNIAGGGFMLISRDGEEMPTVIDYRETAPGAASETMFTHTDKQQSAKAVGVPGTIRGLQLAHEIYGSVPWRVLIEPAHQLALEGFVIDAGLAKSLNQGLASTPADFKEFHRVYGAPTGGRWKAGDTLKQTNLAATLRLIADYGPDAFYRGPISHQIIEEINRGDGIMTQADLIEYVAEVTTPHKFSFQGYDIYSPQPPSSGGICLTQILQMFESSQVSELDRWSTTSVHFRIESMRRAFADRAKYLGDPSFVKIPETLTSPEHIQSLANSIQLNQATVSQTLAPELFEKPESTSTTHFSVIDSHGLAVSNTYTLEESFGSRIVVEGAGFLLNNEMGDFNWFPGETNETGQIGTSPNVVAPGKRMLSSMTPVIVQKDNQTILVLGSPGGRTIINTVANVLINVLAYKLDLPTAVKEPRFHHQWLPDQVQLEASLKLSEPHLAPALEQLGHKVVFANTQGDVHAIARDPETHELIGVSDSRLSGSAKGDAKVQEETETTPKLEIATFGNGCFWCTEAVFLELKGVHSVVSGYTGGALPNPTYQQVCTGQTGHAEVIKIEYDPKVVSFDLLLRVFFMTHDPTTLNRQGADVGTQYRSAIFYHNDDQKQRSEKMIRDLNALKTFRNPIVTEVTKAVIFYPAEDYHQNYFALNGRQPYCSAVIAPKIAKFRKEFKDVLKPLDELD